MSQAFRFDFTDCAVTNLNPRREKHGDENEVAYDLKVSARAPAGVLEQLFAPQLKEVGLDKQHYIAAFWDPSGEPLPLGLHLPVKLGAKLEDQSLVLSKFSVGGKQVIEVEGAKAKGFAFTPKPECQLELEFQVQFVLQETDAKLMHRALRTGQVAIEFRTPERQPDMLDQGEEDADGDDPAADADGVIPGGRAFPDAHDGTGAPAH